MKKKEIRSVFLQKRQNLSDAEFLQLNYQLCEQFFNNINLSSINVLHTFLPIEKNKEPDTWLIINRIRRDFPYIKLSVPRVNNTTSALENFYFEESQQLESNAWGILEPKQGVPTPEEKLDMVLVPLLAFDLKGNRVGYGKGFYDRLISLCREDCKHVGISFFNPVQSIDDLNQFDRPLTQAITPQEVFTFNAITTSKDN